MEDPGLWEVLDLVAVREGPEAEEATVATARAAVIRAVVAARGP